MEAQQSALQQSSEKWVEELSRAAEELNGAAKQIQADFAAASVRSVSNGYVRARFFATRKESSLVDCGFTRAYVCACCLRHSSSVLLRACHFHSQDPIPDLVSMIRRIQQLETTMTHLQRACKEIAAKRKVVLPLAYEQISDNQVLLSQVRNGIV